MSDMTAVTMPKSDQLNADDLIGAPRTIRITSVDIRPGTEQPVSIHYEGEDGRPYKPCKSMCRVMVFVWGADASHYAGRSMTLYRDPTVKWGGMEIGGIRISHMTHMQRETVMSLTTTKGSRKPYRVCPLSEPAVQSLSQKLIEWARGQFGKCSVASDVSSLMSKIEAHPAWGGCSADERAAITAMRNARLTDVAPRNTGEITNSDCGSQAAKDTDPNGEGGSSSSAGPVSDLAPRQEGRAAYHGGGEERDCPAYRNRADRDEWIAGFRAAADENNDSFPGDRA